jgi:hypothetical protein
MADKVTKICMDIYRKLGKSRVLNIIERLQNPNILAICYLYNLQWKYVKKYISIQASIFLFVSSVLKAKKKNIYILICLFQITSNFKIGSVGDWNFPNIFFSSNMCLECRSWIRKLSFLNVCNWYKRPKGIMKSIYSILLSCVHSFRHKWFKIKMGACLLSSSWKKIFRVCGYIYDQSDHQKQTHICFALTSICLTKQILSHASKC